MASDENGEENVLLANGGRVLAVIFFGFAAVAAFTTIAEQLGAPDSALTGVIFTLTAAVLVLMSWSAATKNPLEFYVAGRSLSPAVNALAGLAGWLAIPAFPGLAGLLFTFGFDGLAFVVGPLCGLFVSGVLIAPYLAISNTTTVPEFLGLRFGRPARVISAVIIVCTSIAVFVLALSLVASMAARMFDLPLALTTIAAGMLIGACVMPGGMNSVSWTGAAAALIFLMTLAGLTIAMSAIGFGHLVPPQASAEALQVVSNLEISMIEKGLADAAAMKPHAKPFLQIQSGNFFGLVFSLAAATAALPHLLHRPLTVPTPGAARSATAALLGWAMLVLMAASTWAIFAKFQVFSLVEAGTAFGALPDWAFELSRSGGLLVHGLSVELVDHVIAAVRSGAITSAQVTSAFLDHSASVATAWAGLKEPVKAALIETARSAPQVADTSAFAWQALQEKLFALAAASAGNKQGVLTLSALRVDAEVLMHMMPSASGLPRSASVFSAVSWIAILIAIAGASLWAAVSVLSHDIVPNANAAQITAVQMRVARSLSLVLCLAGAAVSLFAGVDWTALTPIALSAAASSLVVVLIAAIWWPRANGAGAALAMLAGLAITLLYAVGTQYFPVSLYEMWPAASDALPAATAKLEAIKSALAAASGEQATVIAAKLHAVAGGTPFKPGIANWWGLGGACAAVFAVPAAVIAMVLGSLLGPKPYPSQREFVEILKHTQGAGSTSSTVL